MIVDPATGVVERNTFEVFANPDAQGQMHVEPEFVSDRIDNGSRWRQQIRPQEHSRWYARLASGTADPLSRLRAPSRQGNRRWILPAYCIVL